MHTWIFWQNSMSINVVDISTRIWDYEVCGLITLRIEFEPFSNLFQKHITLMRFQWTVCWRHSVKSKEVLFFLCKAKSWIRTMIKCYVKNSFHKSKSSLYFLLIAKNLCAKQVFLGKYQDTISAKHGQGVSCRWISKLINVRRVWGVCACVGGCPLASFNPVIMPITWCLFCLNESD